METWFQNALWLVGFFGAGLFTGFLLFKVGVSTISTDISSIKTMLAGSKTTVTSPSTVHVNVSHTATPTSTPVVVAAPVAAVAN